MSEVHLTKPAQKDLDSLNEIKTDVVKNILELKENPKKGHYLKQNLQGIQSLDFTIKGSGQYRAAYIFLEDKDVCLVVAIAHHEGFYNLLARRAKLLKETLKELKQPETETKKENKK